jgi:TubC N-terminal docking domain
VNARSLFHDLRALGVILEAQGEYLKVDAPAGVLTEEHRAALKEHKPKLLKRLSRPREEPEEAPERESVARWAGPGVIRIRDPFTGEWHRWPADECLPSVVAEADRLRKGTSLGDFRNHDSPR